MSESILLNFTIGIFIGGMIGVMGMALLSASRYGDMTQEIMELRAQRKLLKEEIANLPEITTDDQVAGALMDSFPNQSFLI